MNAETELYANAIAIGLAPIRVNPVCPGFVDTEPPTSAPLAVNLEKLLVHEIHESHEK